MDYKKAGVDISSLDSIKKRMARAVKSTFNDNVTTDFGHFGGGFRLTDYKKPVLVSSTDSVGTKVKVAYMAGVYTGMCYISDIMFYTQPPPGMNCYPGQVRCFRHHGSEMKVDVSNCVNEQTLICDEILRDKRDCSLGDMVGLSS